MVFSQRHNHRLSRWLAQRYKGILPAGLKAHRKICQPQRTPQKGCPFGGRTFTTAEPWWWIRPLTADTKHKGHPKRGVLLGVEPLPRQSRGGGFAPSPPTPNTKDTPEGCPLCLVPVVGVEPTRYRYHRILSPARLPIPSHRRMSLATHTQTVYHKWSN